MILSTDTCYEIHNNKKTMYNELFLSPSSYPGCCIYTFFVTLIWFRLMRKIEYISHFQCCFCLSFVSLSHSLLFRFSSHILWFSHRCWQIIFRVCFQWISPNKQQKQQTAIRCTCSFAVMCILCMMFTDTLMLLFALVLLVSFNNVYFNFRAIKIDSL